MLLLGAIDMFCLNTAFTFSKETYSFLYWKVGIRKRYEEECLLLSKFIGMKFLLLGIKARP